MKRSYPYLKDPRAIAEIRKHQWIESEKAGREIGFGTATVDWVNKYGLQWEAARGKFNKNVFIENRKYRRFELQSLTTLIQGDKRIKARTIDISLQGILCIIKENVQAGSNVTLQWSFEPDGKSGVVFNGKIFRVWPCQNNSAEFELLIKFDEESREKLENWAK